MDKISRRIFKGNIPQLNKSIKEDVCWDLQW
jgi:hypothetical protein